MARLNGPSKPTCEKFACFRNSTANRQSSSRGTNSRITSSIGAIGDGKASLTYLAPYVFKVAIGESRIVSVQNRTVTFKYQEQGSRRYRIISLDVMEFIRRFLQHVLPTGFMKVRHLGFTNAICPMSIETIRAMILKQHHF